MRLLTLIGLLLWNCHASASECKSYESFRFIDNEPSRCQCENFPKQLNYWSGFKSLKLVAACHYQQMQGQDGEPDSFVGFFFYRGAQIFSGVLRREPSEFINEFTFKGAKLTFEPPFYDYFVDLSFSDEAATEKKFKAPKPNEKTQCWEANIKFKVTEMQSNLGIDNMLGHFPRKYEVLKIGPYRKCFNPTPDPFAQ